MQRFDRIVVGVGGVGGAVCYHLACRGANVLGLERHSLVHDRGSSHGETRIIRRAYFEHPDYVPLLDRAYVLWDELQAETGEALFERTGLLEVGPPDGVVIPGILASVNSHSLSVEEMTSSEVAERFPGFVVPAEYVSLFESDAGFLHVERCVAAYASLAAARGATCLTNQDVQALDFRGSGDVVVHTKNDRFAAGGVVVTAGAWSESILGQSPFQLEVLRKHMNWFACNDSRYFAKAGAPAFFYELDHGCFYGFPSIDGRRVKVAEHTGGERVADPSHVSREPDPNDLRRVTEFIEETLPGVAASRTAHQVCLYTQSPDGHFIVDRYADHPQLVFAAGLSGHGFKFTSVLGQALASMALGESPDVDIAFLGSRRFGA